MEHRLGRRNLMQKIKTQKDGVHVESQPEELAKMRTLSATVEIKKSKKIANTQGLSLNKYT
jgi:hypothetical protein